LPSPCKLISRIALLPVSATITPRAPGMRAMPIGFRKRELGSAPSRCAGLKHPELSEPTWMWLRAAAALRWPVPSRDAASAMTPFSGLMAQYETSFTTIYTPRPWSEKEK
jgi:hypothetical protein